MTGPGSSGGDRQPRSLPSCPASGTPLFLACVTDTWLVCHFGFSFKFVVLFIEGPVFQLLSLVTKHSKTWVLNDHFILLIHPVGHSDWAQGDGLSVFCDIWGLHWEDAHTGARIPWAISSYIPGRCLAGTRTSGSCGPGHIHMALCVGWSGFPPNIAVVLARISRQQNGRTFLSSSLHPFWCWRCHR